VIRRVEHRRVHQLSETVHRFLRGLCCGRDGQDAAGSTGDHDSGTLTMPSSPRR
jgi:hypothetical protein